MVPLILLFSGQDSQAPPPSVQTVGEIKSDQHRSEPAAGGIIGDAQPPCAVYRRTELLVERPHGLFRAERADEWRGRRCDRAA